ncbi:MAG: IS5 family transposase [Pseudomonadales bacterium]
MRGETDQSDSLFSYVSLEDRVPKHHPLRRMRKLVDEVLTKMDSMLDAMYAEVGRPSIPPERLIRASLLQCLYTIRSERQLMEQLDYNLLFRWFVGLGIDEKVWNASTFSKNRDRLASADIGKELFGHIVDLARRRHLLSDGHFSVDGTLIAAWASQKSVRRKDGHDDDNPDGVGRNAGRNFHGESRKNDTHASRTGPDSRLASKSHGIAARPSYTGHTMMENRNGLLVDADLTLATGTAERETAAEMATHLKSGATVGADKGYDTQGFVSALRKSRVTPHVAQNSNRRGGSAIDGRTTRHEGYVISQRIRKRIEEAFGWAKQIGGLRQTKYRGLSNVRQHYLLVMAAYNLVRLRKLVDSV